jgi:hypothetical protein
MWDRLLFISLPYDLKDLGIDAFPSFETQP